MWCFLKKHWGVDSLRLARLLLTCFWLIGCSGDDSDGDGVSPIRIAGCALKTDGVVQLCVELASGYYASEAGCQKEGFDFELLERCPTAGSLDSCTVFFSSTGGARAEATQYFYTESILEQREALCSIGSETEAGLIGEDDLSSW